jgi:hypothetical protein
MPLRRTRLPAKTRVDWETRAHDARYVLPVLDTPARGPYRRSMAQSIFVFDFGTNEEAAQQARHKIEGWKQGFRLGNKMMLKFEREEIAAKGDGEEGSSAKQAKKPAEKKSVEKKEDTAEAPSRVKLLLKLDFSEHEKLSHQRWLDRIPGEEPFKSAKAETIRSGDPEHPKVAERFESLD